MDARPLGVLHRFPGALDIVAAGAREAADARFVTSLAISRTASKSPLEAIGKPASITSTPISSSTAAISNFSSRFIEAPGDCSPSRRVVSKMMTRSSVTGDVIGAGDGGVHGT